MDGMLEVAILLVFAALTFSLVVRAVKKRRAKGKGRGARTRGPIDAWIEEVVSIEVAKKASLEREFVLKALRSEPDPDVVQSMEQAVASIQIAYFRLPEAGEAEARVEVRFEDGSSHVTRKRFVWDALPEAIRDEFARTSAAHVYRTWCFPWTDPETL